VEQQWGHGAATLPTTTSATGLRCPQTQLPAATPPGCIGIAACACVRRRLCGEFTGAVVMRVLPVETAGMCKCTSGIEDDSRTGELGRTCCPVIASAAKQSIFGRGCAMDCFASLAMTMGLQVSRLF
jgi:hypothetical protein